MQDKKPVGNIKMPDPNIYPPPYSDHQANFMFWPGDRVIVPSFVEGVVTAVAVNSTGGHVVLIDNGLTSRWYAESMVQHPYMYFNAGEGMDQGKEATLDTPQVDNAKEEVQGHRLGGRGQGGGTIIHNAKI